jgi:hypothetical protein
LIKIGPVTDLTWLKAQFDFAIDCYVICDKTEVKEIMISLNPQSVGKIIYVFVHRETQIEWDGVSSVQTKTAAETIFFEPHGGIIKCGFNRNISPVFGLHSENKFDTFFTGEKILPSWMGRTFRLVEKFTGSVGKMKKRLKELHINKANITTRDFILKATELHGLLELKDGGDYYLFFTGKEIKTIFICKVF